MNSKLGSNKFSTAEKSMNKVILVYIGILIAEVILCSGLRYGYGFDLQYDSFKEGTEIVDHWYLGNYWPRNAINVLQDIFSFLVIFNNIVPISLYVTLEVQKFVGMLVIVVIIWGYILISKYFPGSMFLEWDRDLYDPDTDEAAKVNSSDLNEELGQIEVLFSDKTGTLTENVMVFKEASINGVQYDAEALQRKGQFSSFTNQSDRTREDYEDLDGAADLENEIDITEFLTVLAVCHTVQVARSHDGAGVDNAGYQPDQQFEHLQYDAASPDEKALIEACASFGVQFLGEEETETAVVTRLAETRQGGDLSLVQISPDTVLSLVELCRNNTP